MQKKVIALLLAAVLLSGCAGPANVETVPETTAEPTTAATLPPLKSYTGEVNDEVVATIGEIQLTNRELQAWYWAEVAQYRQENHDTAPDFDISLDRQPCEIDETAETWQEYFLWEAVDAWHTAQALLLHSREVPLPVEEKYHPSENYHQQYMEGMPATKFLYRYNPYYQLNTMHEEYLNELPATLDAMAKEKGYTDAAQMAENAFGTSEEILNSYVDLYNQAYMYFTTLSYYMEKEVREETEGTARSTEFVDIRHILLIPENTEEEAVSVGKDGRITCSESAWAACESYAQELLNKCNQRLREPEHVFAELAVKNSKDTGTALDGGAYHGIQQGQLMEELDSWCFSTERQPGDTAIIRSEYGVHILYFVEGSAVEQVEEERNCTGQQLAAALDEIRQLYPVEVNYDRVVLCEADGTVAAEEILYPDVAHERFPEVPLYLQQDYPYASYGMGTLAGNGCGVTSMAMLASYMTDEELTPATLAARFGHYCVDGGTDSTFFKNEPSGMGFYLDTMTYSYQEALQALHAGRIVVSLQHAGYWTRAGHYIVIEKIDENDMIQVRDSNIFNYARLSAHKEDLHRWGTAVGSSQGYWIYEPKITRIPACCRCGSDEAITGILLTEDYLCHKCQPALLRREAYLNS